MYKNIYLDQNMPSLKPFFHDLIYDNHSLNKQIDSNLYTIQELRDDNSKAMAYLEVRGLKEDFKEFIIPCIPVREDEIPPEIDAIISNVDIND